MLKFSTIDQQPRIIMDISSLKKNNTFICIAQPYSEKNLSILSSFNIISENTEEWLNKEFENSILDPKKPIYFATFSNDPCGREKAINLLHNCEHYLHQRTYQTLIERIDVYLANDIPHIEPCGYGFMFH